MMKAAPQDFQEVFTTHSDRLLAQAVIGKGDLIEWLMSSRSSNNPRRRSSIGGKIAALIAGNENLLLSSIPPLEKRDLVLLHGAVLPVCLEPEMFSLELPRMATESLVASETLQPVRIYVERILNDSIFTPGNRRFRTSSLAGVSRIEGANDKSFRSLFSLAHELGHCLIERGHVKTDCADEFASEAFAHLMETALTLPMLRTGNSNWSGALRQYQRRVDSMNLAYFGIEYGMENPWSIALREWVSPRMDVFRESLFTLEGYQLNYAVASLYRWIVEESPNEVHWKWNL